MRVCAGITTWQDGDALTNCLASIANVVDEVVFADGLIAGVDAHGVEPFTDRADLWDAWPTAHVAQRRWSTQSQQRNFTLDTARALDCEWLLAIDADEELRNPESLRPWLQVWRFDAFPLPFYFTDEWQAQPCAFKCLHVPDWRRYVCQGSILESAAGEIVQVMGQTTWNGAREAHMPYLVHRPELRPPGRRDIRLSEVEVELEPYPPEVRAWNEPTYAPALLEPDTLIDSLAAAARHDLPLWYCPACGRRYAGPGSCSRQHEIHGLEPLKVAGVAA